MSRLLGPLAQLALLAFTACGGTRNETEAPAQGNTPTEPTPSPPSEEGFPEPTPAPAGLTAEQCEASGGTIVHDIGDGAIHRPDYRCPSGAPPAGPIQIPEGNPVPIEGSVCCPN